jgi:hypothetical protein
MLVSVYHAGGLVMPMTVLLADLPRLLDDVVSDVLEDAEGIRLLRNPRTDGDVAAAAADVDADVVVVAREDPADLASIDRHIADLAGRSILALAPGGHSAWLYYCQCDASKFRELYSTLLEVVRLSSAYATPGVGQ